MGVRPTNKLRIGILYGVIFASAAFALHWLEVQYAIKQFSTEIYIVMLALLFAGLGVWLGQRIATPEKNTKSARNEQAIKTLGLTPKELEVLQLVAEGGTNADIAQRLFVSKSTIKTHLVHVYQKLDVSRRTEAVNKAQDLKIIP